MRSPPQIQPGILPRFQAPGRDALRTGQFGFLSDQEIRKMIQQFTGHCGNLTAALMGDPTLFVGSQSQRPRYSKLLHNKHSYERRNRPFYDVVRCPSQVEFKWRLDAQIKGTGEDISCPRLEASFQLGNALIYL